jgi:ubiquinone/menaquinone biosynthesis C-methylase UbiE
MLRGTAVIWPLQFAAVDGVRQAYGGLAERYIELFDSIEAFNADDLALIDRHLSVESGTVLDVGCGPGRLTDYLRAERGVDSVGFDLVPEFINHARITYPDSRYEVGSMAALPFPDRSIAGVVSWYSLIHIPPADLAPILTELRRVMDVGGKLVAGFFDGDEVAPFEHKVTTAYFWPADEMSTRLAAAGFTEVERIRRPSPSVEVPRPQAVIAAIAS